MLNFEEICDWLRQTDAAQLERLWQQADSTRRERVGDDVWFRGLVELSNICRRNCLYCGIRTGHAELQRYRLNEKEILECAELADSLHYGTLVLQAGEDLGLSDIFMERIIREITRRFPITITLSLGERTLDEWKRWKDAGATRYFLRFETSNQKLFDTIHPELSTKVWENSRIDLLHQLREIGYEIGSGVMVGIPGQSISDLARDLMMFQTLDLDMIGCGPFLPHPQTPLGNSEVVNKLIPIPDEQVANTNEMAFKVIALTRLLCPDANIPSTTAIATIDSAHGRISALSRGANVVMPNLSPMIYRLLYEIYPNKAATQQTAQETDRIAREQVTSIGRTIGQGSGSRQRSGRSRPRTEFVAQS